MAKKSTERTTTIINNPSGGDSGGSMGMLVGLVILLIIGYFFWVYGLPALRSMQYGGAPQINIPSKIDINVNQTK